MTSYLAVRWSAIRREDIVVGPQSGALFRVVTVRSPAPGSTVIASLAPWAGMARQPVTLVLERPAGELVSTYVTDDSRAVALLVRELDARVLGWTDPTEGPGSTWFAPAFHGDEAGLQHHLASMHCDHLMAAQTGAALLSEHADQHAAAPRDGAVPHRHGQDA